MTTANLTPRMIDALRAIAARSHGTDQRTESALRRRGLVTDSDSWPYAAVTTLGRQTLERLDK